MANEVDYRLIQSISESYARGQDMAYENAMRPVRMQNEFMNQRIQQLKMREAENEFLTKMGRQEAAKNAFRPAQPAQTAAPMQTGSAPSYTGNAFAQNMYGNQVETAPARPASFDTQGYVANRYGAGDIEGAQAGEDRQTALRTQKMGMYKPLYDAAVSSGNNEQFQMIVENMKREGLLPADFKAEVSPTGEVESVITITEGSVNPSTGQPWTDPVTGQPLAPGQYSATAKGGRIMKIEPYQDKGSTGVSEPALAMRAAKGDKEAQKALDYLAKKRATNEQNMDFRNESAMRKEFLTLPEVKEYPTIEAQSKRALAALSDPNKNKVAVDQAIITTFNKMMDPSSVVRESEYARTPQDMAILNRIKGKMEKLATGGAGLTDDERQAMYRMVSAFKDISDAQYNEQVDYYGGLAQRYGYKPENIVRLGGKKGSGAAPAPGATPPKAGPAVGSVNKGYRFKGGDPAKKENWEKI